MRDCLSVAGRPEHMPATPQLAAQLAKVVDLAVEHDPDGLVLVGDRRIPGLEVDDREAVLTDDACATAEMTFGVGTSVSQHAELVVYGAHPGGRKRVDRAGDAAHWREVYEGCSTPRWTAARVGWPSFRPTRAILRPMTRPLRIVHVISTVEGIGGAETAMAAVVRASCERGDQVLVLNPFVTATGLQIAERLYAPARVVRFPCRSAAELPILLLRVRAGLRAARPDVIHAHLFHAAVLVAALKRTTTAALLLSHQHGDHFMATGQRIHEGLDRWSGRRFERVVGCSQSVADFLLYRYGYPPSRVTFVRNGWSGAPRAPAPDEEPRIVCVARLRAQKDHPSLLRAFAGVLRNVPRAWLDVVGDGPERAALERLADDLEIRERVVFHGDLLDVWPLLARATVFALSSTYEPLGIAALEAMAAGLPVVASDVGGLREIVRPGETGWLVPAREPRPLGRRLTQLLLDRTLAVNMGANGRKAAEAHRSNAMAAAFLEVYDDLVVAP